MVGAFIQGKILKAVLLAYTSATHVYWSAVSVMMLEKVDAAISPVSLQIWLAVRNPFDPGVSLGLPTTLDPWAVFPMLMRMAITYWSRLGQVAVVPSKSETPAEHSRGQT